MASRAATPSGPLSGKTRTRGADDSASSAEASNEQAADIGRLPPTRPAGGTTEPSSGAKPAERPMDSQRPDQLGPDQLAETKRTAAFEKLVTAPIARKSASEDHFTAVAEGDLDRADRPETPPAWVSPRTWMLVASLIAVGLAVWYFLQPPSADRLYEQIKTMPAGPDRTAVYETMRDMIIEDAPYQGSLARTRRYLIQPWLKNFKPTEGFWNHLKYLDVDMDDERIAD